jgi:NitT/TauT family transport system substrate-binding protein
VHSLILPVLLFLVIVVGCGGSDGTPEVRITRGAGGVGFLPLLMMERHKLIEKHAAAAGVPDVRVRWLDLGGPAIVNDAIISGSADFVAAGPPAFLILWDRTRDSIGVQGVAAITSLPMYLNARAPHLLSLEDLGSQDKIAVTAVKVSIPAIVMQMYARERYGPSDLGRFDRFTVSMTHPDAVIALLSGSGAISAHFASPPFHQRELKDPAVRTILTSDEVMGGSTTFTMLSTTRAFREKQPELYRAVLAALTEANELIVADPQEAARLLLGPTSTSAFTLDDMMDVLKDPAVKFTTTPENFLKYAHFMQETGSISTRPESWTELFFPEIHGAPGS